MTSNESQPKTFTQNMWAMDEQTLIQGYIVGRRKGDDQTALAVLQAKALVEARKTASASRELARQTGHLATATIVLAVLTFFVATASLITAILAFRAA